MVGVPRALPHRGAHQRRACSSGASTADSLERIAAEHGVPPEYIVAILGVETNYGRITGRYRVLDALATLAFDYPPRSDFFRNELEQFSAPRARKTSSIRSPSRAPTPAPWARRSSCPRATGAMPSMPTPTASATCGTTGTTSSPASRTICASTAGEPGAPVLAEAHLEPRHRPSRSTPRNLELNETRRSPRARRASRRELDVPARHPGAADLGRAAGRPRLSRRLQQLPRHHALQPQRPLRDGRARSRPGAWRRACTPRRRRPQRPPRRRRDVSARRIGCVLRVAVGRLLARRPARPPAAPACGHGAAPPRPRRTGRARR